jgi:hypothetical protein
MPSSRSPRAIVRRRCSSRGRARCAFVRSPRVSATAKSRRRSSRRWIGRARSRSTRRSSRVGCTRSYCEARRWQPIHARRDSTSVWRARSTPSDRCRSSSSRSRTRRLRTCRSMERRASAARSPRSSADRCRRRRCRLPPTDRWRRRDARRREARRASRDRGASVVRRFEREDRGEGLRARARPRRRPSRKLAPSHVAARLDGGTGAARRAAHACGHGLRRTLLGRVERRRIFRGPRRRLWTPRRVDVARRARRRGRGRIRRGDRRGVLALLVPHVPSAGALVPRRRVGSRSALSARRREVGRGPRGHGQGLIQISP